MYSEPENQRSHDEVPEIRALIGRATRFDGTLVFEGRVRIEGTLHGAIRGEGIVVLGPGAEVEGDIQATTVLVLGGSVKGTVVATRLIEVHKTAEVRADLRAPLIDIAKGAFVDGRCVVAASSEHGMVDEKAADD